MANESSMGQDGGPASPVHEIGDLSRPSPGAALCLSGGGFRAMVFHLGVLWRLNEAGLLKGLKRISSVSGGSITSALLGLKWPKLAFDASGRAQALEAEVVGPIRELAGHTVDAVAMIAGALLPGTVNERVARAYDKHLYHGATLQDLPDDDQGPRFVINATNVQTGSLWRFMKPYMRDYQVGEVKSPTVPLSQAVGASSAFPPTLSPARLEVDARAYAPGTLGPCGSPPFTTHVVLTDGGVYDNLGLETAWKRYETIYVSDAGGTMAPDPTPHANPLEHMARIMEITDNQVRDLRKRQVVGSYASGARKGAYWGIRTDIQDYARRKPGLTLPLAAPHDLTMKLADIATRMAALDDASQERLINWGYAVCDAALRAFTTPAPAEPEGFPYPGRGVSR
jgi:NTE family protein